MFKSLTTLASVLLLLLLCSCAREHLEPRPPNILLILADDLGVNDVSGYGGTNANTPSVDSIAERGVRFTRFYAESTCSPARAALLTGLYPSRTGFTPNGRGISPETMTLPRALQAEGYVTHHIGKWHLGDTIEAARPHQQGFDTSLAFTSQWRLAGKRNPDGEVVLAKPTYFNPWLTRNGAPEEEYSGHLNDVLTDRALDIIDESGDKPWFINLWYYAPHSPIEPAARFTGGRPMRDQKPEYYRYLVEQLDHNIGRLLQRLERRGAADNTVIVFVSDNGGTNKQADNNAPYGGRKGSFREGALRVPLIIAAPAISSGAGTTDEISSITDIYPTLMALVDSATPPQIDGISLLPALTGAQLQERELYWESYAGRYRSYGILSANGEERFHLRMLGANDVRLISVYNFEADPTGNQQQKFREDQLDPSITQGYRDWHLQVHKVDVHLSHAPAGQLAEGDSFQRSPGFGMFTFATAIEPGNMRSNHSFPIVSQEGIWALSYKVATEQFVLNILGLQIIAQGTFLPGCNSVAVSGDFRHKLSNQKPLDGGASAQLYLNGHQLATDHSDTLAVPVNLSTPTFIGHYSQTETESGQAHGKPLFLNVQLREGDPYSPMAVHKLLCSDQTPLIAGR